MGPDDSSPSGRDDPQTSNSRVEVASRPDAVQLALPDLGQVVRLASMLTVLDQATNRLLPLRLTPEQVQILELLLVAARCLVLKGRQVGSSTVCALFCFLVAACNPGLPCAIVANKQAVADALLHQVRLWCGQLGIRLPTKNTRRLELPNGATIDALSAVAPAADGESSTGRGRPYGFVLATEVSFWANAQATWASITSTTSSASSRIVAESTGAAGESLFRSLYEGDDEGWRRLFLSVESHEGYRADPDSITDEQWAQLQAEHGFTRRDSAAWWLHKLHVDLRGDLQRMLREYPPTPAACFAFKTGVYVERYEVCDVVEEGAWNVYPGLQPEPVVVGVDTSAGLGLDASALAFVGHKTGKPHRTWRDATTPIPAFTSVVWRAVLEHRPVAVVIESNGVGQSVWQSLRAGVPPPGLFTADEEDKLEDVLRDLLVVEQKSSNAPTSSELWDRRSQLKAAIESAEFPVAGHLLAEVQSSSVDKHRRFVGMDDVLSALSFARKWRQANPYRAPVEAVDHRRVYSVEQRLRARRLREGRVRTW